MNLEQLVKTKLGIQSKQTEWKSLNLQDDLALDSLGILTVIGELEGEMGVPIELHADDDSPIQTVGDLLHRITGTSSNPMASKHIVLTGATGFIGRNLLADFLRSGARVTALVRKQGARSVRERLIAVLEPVARDCSAQIEDRLTVVEGDITLPECGLETGLFHGLDGEVIEFWHVAASLAFESARREQIFEHNVGGTENVLALATRLQATRFVYMSTAYTAGARGGEIREELHPLTGPFNNCYEESKCHAEHRVATTCEQKGLEWAIVRPGIVLGPIATFGTGGSTSGLYGFCREMHRYRKILGRMMEPLVIDCEADMALNHIPVDILTADAVQLSMQDFGDQRIYHLTGNDQVSVESIFAFLCDQLAIDKVVMGPGQTPSDSALQEFLDSRIAFYRPYLFERKTFVSARSYDLNGEQLCRYLTETLNELKHPRKRNALNPSVLQLSGEAVRTFEFGNPNGEPVVLINAYGMPAEFWLPLARVLGQQYRLITWETRGVSDTNQPFCDERVGPEHHVEDALAILDAFGLTQPHIIGWCTGAQIALRLAAQHPTRVRTLSLLNGAFRFEGTTSHTTAFQDQLEGIMANASKSLNTARLFSRVIYSSSAPPPAATTTREDVSSVLTSIPSEVMHLTAAPYRTAESLYRYARMCNAINRSYDSDWSDRVTAPTFVLTGSQDTIAHPKSSTQLAERVTDAELVIIEDADHFSLYLDPSFPDRLLQFWQRHSMAA